MRQKTIWMAAVAAVTLLALAACGSSSKSATGATSSATAAATQQSNSAIPVGFISSASGSQSATLGETPKAFAAWIKSVNDAGGINGHMLIGYAKDDGGAPGPSLSAVKELVQQDHVVAIVGDSSADGAVWAK